MSQLKGKSMPLGAMMIDVAGTRLSDEDVTRLMDPKVAGIILFSRNFESIAQLSELVSAVHNLRHPRLLVGVDHEGGRVQRFKEGFTHLPPMRALGQLYRDKGDEAIIIVEHLGWLLAAELLALGIDFSFAPVVDLDYGGSKVIGDRAFSASEKEVSLLASALIRGMHEAGMASVAKHFPGHGFIEADSHFETAVDERELSEIELHDIKPFKGLINQGVDAVMPAHVIYAKVDPNPAGFSPYWLQKQLREKLRFEGVIVSDDLSMQAAKEFGDVATRVRTALEAGCDLVLLCNDTDAANEALHKVQWRSSSLSHARLIRMHGHHSYQFNYLHKDPRWQAASQWSSYIWQHYCQEPLL